ncbi:MAG: TonB-dependent receptor, partial [Acidobacteriota bacterium]
MTKPVLPSIVVAALISLLLTFGHLPARAQSQALDGQIEGTITDPNGAAVSRALVTARNLETGTTRTAATDESGVYRFPLLPLGTYRITVEVSNFKRFVRDGITLAAGQAAAVNIQLEPGDVKETVTISGDASVADTGKTDIGRVMNTREVQNVPLIARNPYQLGRLTANVNGRWNRGFGFPLFNANGLLRRVNYQMDGNVNTQGDRGSIRAMLISDTFVKEIQVITNGFAAEFGNTPGMIMNVITPSGSNKFSGNVSYRFRRPPFYTRPFFFSAAELPESRVDDFTSAIGGPVIKDRWHFYFGYEHIQYDDNASADRVSAIRPKDRDDLVDAGLSPTIFPEIIPSTGYGSFYILRSDVQLNEKNRLVIRFNRHDGKVQNFNAARLSTLDRATDNFSNERALAVQLASYTPRLLNEFRFQITGRTAGEVRNAASGTGPSVTITGVANFGSPVTSGRDVPTHLITQFQDNLTRTSGQHGVKIGGGFNVYTGIHRSNVQSAYTFSSIPAYVLARSGADPYSYTSYVESFGEPGVPYRATFWNFFAQDDWKVTRRLKVNYGLRYDLYRIPKADPTSPFPASQKFNVDKNNFAPRLALVYTLREGRRPTILRGGAGIYYDAPLLFMYRRAVQNNGNSKFLTVSFTPASPNGPAFPNTFSGNLPPGSQLPPPDIDAIAPDLKNMYAIHSNVQVEQAITEDLSFAVGYVHSGGRHIPIYRSINCLPTGGTLADGRPLYGPQTLPINPCISRVFPQFNSIQMAEAAGVSRYDALNLQLTRRFSRGFQLSAHYTLSKATDDAPEQNLTTNGDVWVLSDPS